METGRRMNTSSITSTQASFELPDSLCFNRNKTKLPNDMMPEIGELPGDLSELAQVIEEKVPGKGVVVTLAIADHFRGTEIYCHNVNAILRGVRDRYIRLWRDQGLTVPDIARRVRLGERRVWDILNTCEEG